MMAEYVVKRPVNRPPIHPGELVREEVLPALGLSVSETARRLGISRQQFHRILACTHPITPEMALRLGRLAGNGPGLWLRMQQTYDLWHTERCLQDELAKIEPARAVNVGAEQASGADG
jgi:addiction module HigA family antidote